MEKLLNLIFIPECIFCHQEGSFFCRKCLGSCLPSKQQSAKVPNFPIRFIFVYEYERFIREIIRSAKYGNKHFAALKQLTVYALQKIPDKLEIESGSVFVIPVPVSKAKLAKRGFNQAEIIGRTFAAHLKIPIKSNVLIRSKITTSQYTNDKRQRFVNVKNAFEVKNAGVINGKKIILVDDVCTTGATFLECAKVLLKAGAAEVICISIARKS